MKFKNTLDVLNAHTAEIQKILERLEESEAIHSIDLDLMLDKLRTVYDVINDLRSEIHTATESAERSFSEEVPGEEDDSRTIDLTPDMEEPAEEEAHEEIIHEDRTVQKQSQPLPMSRDKERSHEEKVLSDTFKPEKPTLNEEIGSQAKQDDLSSQLKTNPITSLTGAIGLNEKFELINELFDGDKNTFEHTMQVLNASSSFVEAYSYLEEKFEWDMDNPYVQRILELIRRKLIVRRNEQ